MLLRFAAIRLALVIPTMLGVSIVTFILLRVLPGDPIAATLGQNATPVEIEAARERFGLNDPLITQFWQYLTGVLRGDFGTSIQSGAPVRTELLDRLGPTLELVIISVTIALLIAVVVGIWVSLRANSGVDHTVRFVSLLGNSLPAFWIGVILILVFYADLDVLPASGRVDRDAGLEPITGSGILDSLLTGNLTALRSVLVHLILPVATLVITVTAPLLRSVRSSALEVQRSQPFRAAEAHGLPRKVLIRSYLLRPTLVRLPALAALVLGFTLGSVVLVEQVFSWQGLGQWALRGVEYRDYDVVQASVLVMALVFTLSFAVADVVHAILDRRVRL